MNINFDFNNLSVFRKCPVVCSVPLCRAAVCCAVPEVPPPPPPSGGADTSAGTVELRRRTDSTECIVLRPHQSAAAAVRTQLHSCADGPARRTHSTQTDRAAAQLMRTESGPTGSTGVLRLEAPSACWSPHRAGTAADSAGSHTVVRSWLGGPRTTPRVADVKKTDR